MTKVKLLPYVKVDAELKQSVIAAYDVPAKRMAA
jgi:hypothetical protein